MNRCPPLSDLRYRQAAWRRILLNALAAYAVLTGVSAYAQPEGRTFPDHAERGILTVVQPPEVVVNGRIDRLSPGARIRNANNLLVLSATLIGHNLVVNYVREPHGLLHEIWILTPQEALQILPSMRQQTGIITAPPDPRSAP